MLHPDTAMCYLQSPAATAAPAIAIAATATAAAAAPTAISTVRVTPKLLVSVLPFTQTHATHPHTMHTGRRRPRGRRRRQALPRAPRHRHSRPRCRSATTPAMGSCHSQQSVSMVHARCCSACMHDTTDAPT